MKTITGKHILLLLLYSEGIGNTINEEIKGRTRLIKAMFLFDKEIKKDFVKDNNIDLINFPEFYPWKFGPFSKEIYNDLEFFINNSFIEVKITNQLMIEEEIKEFANWTEDFLLDVDKDQNSISQYEEVFLLTQKGLLWTETNLYQILSQNQKQILKNLKERINKVSLDAILRYTYLKYPDYTSKSTIRDNYL